MLTPGHVALVPLTLSIFLFLHPTATACGTHWLCLLHTQDGWFSELMGMLVSNSSACGREYDHQFYSNDHSQDELITTLGLVNAV